MKAVVFERIGEPLVVRDVPAPALGAGDVIVDVFADRVLSYAGEVFSGKRTYPFDLPAVPGPGPIGRVCSLGNDSTKLQVGDWVYCDPTIRARDDALAPDIMLQGLIAPGPGPRRLQAWVGDGGWAEQVRVPTENVTPLGQVDLDTAPQWCALGTLLVPFGGLLAAELQAGETLLVHGATGSFGSAGVAVALAMGAGCVIAPGAIDRYSASSSGASASGSAPWYWVATRRPTTRRCGQRRPARSTACSISCRRRYRLLRYAQLR